MFKCGNCGHDKAHENGGSDRMMVIKNPHLNTCAVLQSCAKCNVLHAFHEKLTESPEATPEEKKAIEGEKSDDVSPQ
jgi:hypothetical protein